MVISGKVIQDQIGDQTPAVPADSAEVKKELSTTKAQLTKEKKKREELEARLAELEAQANGGEGDENPAPESGEGDEASQE